MLGLLLIFIPVILSFTFDNDPWASFFMAWGGGFFVLFISLTGIYKKLPADRPFLDQLFRPIIIVNVLYFLYQVFAPVFYFLDLNGYYYLDQEFEIQDSEQIAYAAQCIRYYFLGYVGLVIGLNFKLNYSFYSKYDYQLSGKFLLRFCIYAYVLSVVIRFLPLVGAIGPYFSKASILTSIVFFAYSYEKEKKYFLIALIIVGFNLLQGFISGMKESSLFILMFMALALVRISPKRTIVFGGITLLLWISFVPTFNGIYRELQWGGAMSSREAFKEILQMYEQGEIDVMEGNWEVLTGRASEINNFIKFVRGVPENRPFYGFEIVENTLLFLIPRVFWPDKPTIEQMTMQRVVDNGITSERSLMEGTSMKPQYVVDAYLSFGTFGVFVFPFVLGLLATQLSKICERIFGGYELGTMIVFTSLFYQIHRGGGSFEMFFNTMLKGYIIMLLIHWAFTKYNIVFKKQFDDQYSLEKQHNFPRS
jgi:hypothetical protein